MKKLLIIVLGLMLASMLFGIKTGKSIFYADSYMLRAYGVEAAYWNPALIKHDKHIDTWIPVLNTGVQVTNNSLDLDTYNKVVGDDYLDEAEKADLLSKVKGSLVAEFSGNHSIAGFTLDNMAFSTSISYMGKAVVSKRYLELMLNGNEDTLYVFNKSQNNVSAMGYIDLTGGMGDIKLPLGDKIPTIKAGFSGSILIGLADAYTQKFDGFLKSTMDGITLHQDVTLRTGVGGIGFKSMLGLVSNPYPGLDVGMTVDNVFGFLNWSGVTEDKIYSFRADSVYVANVNDDFYTTTDETVKTDSYHMSLPPEMRLAAMYSLKQLNVSADYVQGFKESVATDGKGRLAIGAQFTPAPFLKLHWGLGFGNSSYPWRISYGISANSSTAEFGIGVQSFKSVIPGTTSKGIAFGSYLRLWI